MDLSLENVLQIVGTGAMILASTWKISQQITAISTKLDLHVKQDDTKFREVEDAINTIAPRTVRLSPRR